MAILKYNKEDIIPVTLRVLLLSVKFYLARAYKYAIKYHFKDLEGKVDPDDDIDDAGIELIASLDNEVIQMIWSAVKDILSSYLVIQLIYRNDSGGKEPDERQTQLALDFYNTFIIDLFRLSPLRQNDPIDSKDYEQLLLFHISSLLTIVNLLQEINLKGQLDTEEEDGKCKIWGKGIDRGDVQDGVLKALNELGENLDKHQSTYQRYYFNKHY